MKEGSVAPKERVNIVYRPATGDAKEEVELPLKLLILGDFTQRTDDRMLEDRDPVAIDKDTFNDVLKGQGLNLTLSVPNKLSGKDDDQMAVNLDIRSMKDFEPDALAQKIPELAKLLELREALKALKGPLANVPDFRKKVQDLVKDEGVRAKLLHELGIEG
ncbi:type VI secretion system contractile sheath small subunit [uncultured Thiodictyon sp.]|uniref:type VI secretion system contractile sheath small subunit n=1 Tax=uncultured Thiodictyon sp. TaxID=1846217 RepID=UPI0025DCDCF2|nr:type VI secretion system contractile sheath small subunit [uncultured Thiodictyon sp.]